MVTMGPESRCPTAAAFEHCSCVPACRCAHWRHMIYLSGNLCTIWMSTLPFVAIAQPPGHLEATRAQSNQSEPHNQRLHCHSLPQLLRGPGVCAAAQPLPPEFAWCRDVCCYCKRRWQAMPQHGWDRGRLLQREGEAREGRGDKMVSSQASVGLKQE